MGKKEHELSIIINLGVWIYEVVYWGRYNIYTKPQQYNHVIHHCYGLLMGNINPI